MQTAKRVRKQKEPKVATAQRTVHTVVVDDDCVHIPVWVVDLESFRRWVHSDEVPEKLRACLLNDEVWVDLSNEQYIWHVDVKTEINAVLRVLANGQNVGRYSGDGVLLTNIAANLSAGPDGVFVFDKTVEAERVSLVEGKKGGCVELEGTPDMVLEIVSDSSVKKDTVTLRELYWKAGIPEYWLVDARREEVSFEILRHSAKGYTSVRKQDGWVKSTVFGKSFRLVSVKGARGNPRYTLEVR